MPSTFVEINGVQHPAVIVAASPLEMGSGNPLGGQTVTTPPPYTVPHAAPTTSDGLYPPTCSTEKTPPARLEVI